MQKNRKVICILLFLTGISSIYAKGRSITDERAIMLLNYLQYSLAQIRANPNKIVATNEYDTIINNINNTTLKDGNIIEAYNSILTTMTDVKIADEQKQHAEEMAEKERKQAITKLFSSPGSIFVPGQNPAISIAYAAISAGLNYAGARAQIDNKKLEAEFQIEMDLLRSIDSERTNLYISGSKVFQSRDDTQDLITETVMDSFIKAVNIDTPEVRVERLESQKENLKLFPPFWYALGFAYQELKSFEPALEAYNTYERLSADEKILRFDEMLVQIQFSKIDIYAAKGYSAHSEEITQCFNIILEAIKHSTPEVQAQQKFAMAVACKTLKNTAAYEAYLTQAKQLGITSWSETCEVFDKNLEEKIKDAKDKLIKKYTTTLYKEFKEYKDKIDKDVKQTKYSFSENKELSITSMFPYDVWIGKDDTSVENFNDTLTLDYYSNIFTLDQLVSQKAKSKEKRVYFCITDLTNFWVWIKPEYGFGSSDYYGEITLPENEEKIKKINLALDTFYEYNVTTLAGLVQYEKEALACYNICCEDELITSMLNSSYAYIRYLPSIGIKVYPIKDKDFTLDVRKK